MIRARTVASVEHRRATGLSETTCRRLKTHGR
jgi:hypothetical protein